MDNHSFDFLNTENAPVDYLAHDAYVSINQLLAHADEYEIKLAHKLTLSKAARVLAELKESFNEYK